MPDEIDPKLRQRFAWATKLEDVEEPSEPDADDDGPNEEARAEARQLAGELVHEVERVWALPPASQKKAVRALATRVDGMGIRLAAMPHGSIANVRLARLLLRHREALDEEVWSAARTMISFADLSHPEVAELFLDVVRAEAWNMCLTLDLAFGGELALDTMPELADALATIVGNDDEPFGRRALAARLVGSSQSPAAVDALHRALRTPSFELRCEALSALAERIDADATLFLLEDAVIHPLASDDFEAMIHYANDVRAATKLTKPERGVAALMRIAHGQAVYLNGMRDWIDDDWALQTLAAAYPDIATPRIDERLRNGDAMKRYHAVEAARELPHNAAVTRLRVAVADPSLSVARRARKHLEDMGEDSRPVAPALFEILSAPPSDALRARIDMVQTVQDLGALRKKLAPVLWTEAPSEEALVLLMMLFDYGDELEQMLVAFGELAVRAATWMVRAFPNGMHEGWAGRIQRATRSFGEDDPAAITLSDEAKSTLRAAISDAFHSEHWDREGCIPLLHHIGASERHLDVLWTIFLEESGHAKTYAGWELAKHVPIERVRTLLRESWDARNAELFERVTSLVPDHADDDVSAILESVVASAQMPRERAFVTRAVSALVSSKRIGEAWVLEHLNTSDALFEIAASRVHFNNIHSDAIAARLRELHRASKNAHAAAVAAKALVWHKAIAFDDPVLSHTLECASADDCAEICTAALLLGAPFKTLRPHVLRALEHASPTQAIDLIERLHDIRGAKKPLTQLHRLTTSDDVRAAIEDAIDLPQAAASYWV